MYSEKKEISSKILVNIYGNMGHILYKAPKIIVHISPVYWFVASVKLNEFAF